MITIHRKRFGLALNVPLQLPAGCRVIHCTNERCAFREAEIWYFCESEKEDAAYTIFVRGTGDDCGGLSMVDHLATLIYGSYVWHLFISKDPT